MAALTKRTASFQDLHKGHVSEPEARYSGTGHTTPNDGVETSEKRNMLLTSLMSQYLSREPQAIQRQIVNHVEYTLARTRYNFDAFGAYQATSLSVRDRLLESWNDTQQFFTERDVKRVYYLSLEFLMGRYLQNALVNMGVRSNFEEALLGLGYKLEDLLEQERDPGLGNGGLGRLAACFMDSLATLNYPGWGYGIRYKYGMFYQKISAEGYQIEVPDYWLTHGNPWEVERLDVTYPVRFFGHIEWSDKGILWTGGEVVRAIAYDSPIPGYDTYNTLNLRLWSAAPATEFDLDSFSRGDYFGAIANKEASEKISSVLYPNDSTDAGKELRLKQQYFFVSATLQDAVRRFLKKDRPLTELHTKVAIQLNDTHPTIAIVELMRIMMDERGYGWTASWETVQKVFSYTNHTVLPEALEKWQVPLMEKLLPRHMQIIYEINRRFLEVIAKKYPGDGQKLQRMSIIEDGYPKMVRMANLAVVGTHCVNGVAAIHSGLVRQNLFPDFVEEGYQIVNVTNGVTPRRWLQQANPALSEVISRWLETDDWVGNYEYCKGLEQYVDNADLQREFADAKMVNKKTLAALVKATFGEEINCDALFDIQIKRIHEYKRQLLNILGVIARYNKLKRMSHAEREQQVERVHFFGGKAAASYVQAKNIIRLITGVQHVINADADTNKYLKCFFMPNYNVTLAETLIPANDVSEHISTAGLEASGTSNMKFVMNGGIIIGTMDGANIEIREQVGDDQIFIFGLHTPEIEDARNALKYGQYKVHDARLDEAINQIKSGMFCSQETAGPIVRALEPYNDFYLVARDFSSYMEAQDRVDAAYKDSSSWIKRCILAVARMGFFSSDRTIHDYAEKIWGIEATPFVPGSISFKDPSAKA
ncbi:Glycogen phosphorylase 1 [Porphyridium purpureum]|uniref:Alpha-1,4 glucan phosphorylase n=1 Tax=Porphyridium purpureum TaxID=35688 RepID=A0A5J4YXA8_PORPP|nr:Glycogen phosphorylase 1 [Porphyridium purpureum]|eukprot:POR6603..scf209_3